jgi:hypothetical protein
VIPEEWRTWAGWFCAGAAIMAFAAAALTWCG